jgi:hypothetical protein
MRDSKFLFKMQNTQENYGLALFIIGPGFVTPGMNKAYQSPLKFLTQKIKNVAVIGDGEMDIGTINQNNELDGGALLDTLKVLNQTQQELIQTSKVFVYIEAHGLTQNGKHEIQIAEHGQNQFIKSGLLFYLLKLYINKPLDIVFSLAMANRHCLTSIICQQEAIYYFSLINLAFYLATY